MQVNPKGKEGYDRVYRGGSRRDYFRLCCAEFRYSVPPMNASDDLGFRVVLSLVVRKKYFWNLIKGL